MLLVLVVPGANALPPKSGNVLTALADLGVVYWRADCSVAKPQRWSLGVQLFDTATTKVTLRVGRHTAHRIMQPNQFVWFPLATGASQHLVFKQSTEAGTLSGTVSVDFGGQHANHCWSYFPPAVSMRLYPRG